MTVNGNVQLYTMIVKKKEKEICAKAMEAAKALNMAKTHRVVQILGNNPQVTKAASMVKTLLKKSESGEKKKK